MPEEELEDDPVVTIGDGKYRLDSSAKTAVYLGTAVKNPKELKIPDTVKEKSGSITYKVTEIAEGALKNCKKLKKINIGKNVKVIGREAFFGCKNLKDITIRTSNLTKKKRSATTPLRALRRKRLSSVRRRN